MYTIYSAFSNRRNCANFNGQIWLFPALFLVYNIENLKTFKTAYIFGKPVPLYFKFVSQNYQSLVPKFFWFWTKILLNVLIIMKQTIECLLVLWRKFMKIIDYCQTLIKSTNLFYFKIKSRFSVKQVSFSYSFFGGP